MEPQKSDQNSNAKMVGIMTAVTVFVVVILCGLGRWLWNATGFRRRHESTRPDVRQRHRHPFRVVRLNRLRNRQVSWPLEHRPLFCSVCVAAICAQARRDDEATQLSRVVEEELRRMSHKWRRPEGLRPNGPFASSSLLNPAEAAAGVPLRRSS